MSEDKVTAHKVSIYHREQILNSSICGCFHCTEIFKPSEITEWCDFQAKEVGGEKIGRTALCPKCAIDSVIGDASGYPITREFLDGMRRHWF